MTAELGVALTRCFYCLESSDILLNTRLTSKLSAFVRACDGKVVDMSPCSRCQELMGRGVILITISDEQSEPGWSNPPEREIRDRRGVVRKEPGIPNPYRTGGWFVVTDDFVRRVLTGDVVDHVLRCRWGFLEHDVADALGLFEYATSGEDGSS